MKFRVKTGRHAQPGGVRQAGGPFKPEQVYTEGQVIEDDRDLITLFPNKFERVMDDTPVSTPTSPEKGMLASRERQTPEAPSPAAPAPQAKSPTEGAVPGSEPPGTSPGGGTGESEPAAKTLEVADVTEDFPKAQEGGFQVLKYNDGSGYFVADSEDPGKPLNDEALNERKDVNKFLSRLTKNS
jgi:hypothetical protein